MGLGSPTSDAQRLLSDHNHQSVWEDVSRKFIDENHGDTKMCLACIGEGLKQRNKIY